MWNAAIDTAAAKELGIAVCGTKAAPPVPGQGAGNNSTSELTWLLILSLARHLPTEHANVQQGRWQTTVGVQLAHRTLGLVGLGKLGQQVLLPLLVVRLGLTKGRWSLSPRRLG